jgi:hypothetical protein
MAKKVQAETSKRFELFEQGDALEVVHARFETQSRANFQTLITGYTHLRVLTYSNSLSILDYAATLLQDIELIFGRPDIIGEVGRFAYFQEELLKNLKTFVAGKEYLAQRIREGHIRLLTVHQLISHEKLFLLEGPKGKRVITGSANFSEQAFSGRQNESYICFDDDLAAWDYFNQKYQRIRDASSETVPKTLFLEPTFDIDQIPVFAPENIPNDVTGILIDDRPTPSDPIIFKVLTQKTPPQYAGLSQILTPDRGLVRVTKHIRARVAQYVRSQVRTEKENPEEYFSLFLDTQKATLSGRPLSLEVNTADLRQDVALLLDYFKGFEAFRGNHAKLARDYFTFMAWFYASPFICDFRNHALANETLDVRDYPIFGLLYGKSNCGKSQLISTLLLSMFGRMGFLPNDWFTSAQIRQLREQNKRYPMVFDDLNKERFDKYAVPLIKEDYPPLREYPAIVLSMNADKDRFESEVRKRALIIYTDASLPDHTGDMRELGVKIRRLRSKLGTHLYRHYLSRAMADLQEGFPQDVLKFSSQILVDIFSDLHDAPLPAWCQISTMEDYIESKHDKIKEEILALWHYNRAAWQINRGRITLKLDIHSINKLAKDIPDYLIRSKSGDVLVFDQNELEEFLDYAFRFKNKGWHWLKRVKA